MSQKSSLSTWHFAPAGSGEVVGFNEGSTTIFRGNTAYYIAREPIQNIIDVPVRNPVKADFTLLKMKPSLLPGMDYLSQTFKACVNYFNNDIVYDKDCIKFFKTAAEKIDKDKEINVLKISDFNTEGMTESNYFKFMKAVGVSGKASAKGGSFGLGKGAYFAASQFRTIFVSSVYKDLKTGKQKYLFEGKSRLVSFEENGKMMQGNGRFGISLPNGDSTYLSDQNDIPDIFKRTEQGTSVYIIDFGLESQWDIEILKQVLINFWLRIYEGKLEVTVNGVSVNQSNLKEMITSYFKDTKYNAMHEDNPIPFYQAYTDPLSNLSEDDLESIGHVKLKILVRDDFPKQINYFRNTGMRVQNKQHRSPLNFAGVFVCDDEKGAEILRGMENPQHDEWSPNNAKDGRPSDLEKKALKDIQRFIKESLNELIKGEGKLQFTIKGTENYLSIPLNEEDGTDSEIEDLSDGTNNTTETGSEVTHQEEKDLNYKNNKSKPERITVRVFPRNHSGKKKKPSPTTNVILDEKGKIKLKEIKYLIFRSYATKDKNDFVHTILIRGEPNKKLVKTFVYIGTDEGFDEIDLSDVKSVVNNKIYSIAKNVIDGIELDKKGEATINLKINNPGKYSLKVISYENI